MSVSNPVSVSNDVGVNLDVGVSGRASVWRSSVWRSDSLFAIQRNNTTTLAREEDQSVTIVLRHNVKSEEHEAFEEWNKRTAQEAHKFKGHLSSTIVEPAEGRNDFIIVYRFDSNTNLEAWHASKEHLQAAEEVGSLLYEPAATRKVRGWFAVDTAVATDYDYQRVRDASPGAANFNFIQEVAAYSCVVGAALQIPGTALTGDPPKIVNIFSFVFLTLCGILGLMCTYKDGGGRYFVPVMNVLGPFFLLLGAIAFLPSVALINAGMWLYRIGTSGYLCGTVVSIHSIFQIPHFTANSSGRIIWTGLLSFLTGEICFLVGGILQQWGGTDAANDIATHLFIIAGVCFFIGASSFKLS